MNHTLLEIQYIEEQHTTDIDMIGIDGKLRFLYHLKVTNLSYS